MASELKTEIKTLRGYKMERVLKKVLEVNKVKGLDAFFDYSGHVNSFEVRVNKDAEYLPKEEDKLIYVTRVSLDEYENKESISRIIKELQGLING